MAQAMKLLVSPHVADAEAVFTGGWHGRRKQSVVVPRASLRLAAENIMGMCERIAAARADEALPGCSSWMGMRESSLSFGIGMFTVGGFGPNRSGGTWIDGRHVSEEAANGRLLVRFWAKRRAYPALSVLVDEDEAQRLANVLWGAAAGVPFEWTEPS